MAGPPLAIIMSNLVFRVRRITAFFGLSAFAAAGVILLCVLVILVAGLLVNDPAVRPVLIVLSTVIVVLMAVIGLFLALSTASALLDYFLTFSVRRVGILSYVWTSVMHALLIVLGLAVCGMIISVLFG